MKIALLGCGIVGSGVLELLEKNHSQLQKEYMVEPQVVGILIRQPEKYSTHKYRAVMTTSFEDILSLKPDVLIEVMGGINPSKSYLTEALKQGIHVITANKDLLAEHGHDLFQLAIENGSSIRFEASIGGGIPVVTPIRESLKGNRIHAIEGIFNGTTNFILTKMGNEMISYEEALHEAQSLGFAESDPSSDVLGYDAARKICLLSSIAFEKRIKWQEISVEGIENLQLADFEIAKFLGCKVKLLGMSYKDGDDIHCSVRPVFVKETHPLHRIDKEYNGIRIVGDAVGSMLFTGKGAGQMPTASAVYGDLIDCIQRKSNMLSPLKNDSFYKLVKYWNKSAEWLVQIKSSDVHGSTMQLLNTFANHQLTLYQRDEGEICLLTKVDSELQLIEKLNGIQWHGENIISKYRMIV